MHNNIICTKLNCDKKLCHNRHPRPCKFFTGFSFCKFGDDCSFAHPQSKSTPVQQDSKVEQEINEMKEILNNVLSTLAEKEIRIKHLEEKVSILKSRYLCEHCDKTFKSKATLNMHMKKYHEVAEESDHNLETLRESESDNHANLSSFCTSRSEFVSTENQTTSEYKCKYCGKIFYKGNNLELHMIEMHKLPENCLICYGCDEDTSDILAIGQYVVLWDKGVVGGDGVVYPECKICMTSDYMTQDELQVHLAKNHPNVVPCHQ